MDPPLEPPPPAPAPPPAPPRPPRLQTLSLRVARSGAHLAQQALAWLTHLRLPAASILPATGALVGLYAGLAAGLFSNAIGFIHLLGFGIPRLLKVARGQVGHPVRQMLESAPWHPEYGLVGLLAAGVLLGLAAFVGESTDDRTRLETRTRLQVIAGLIVGGLLLFYPLVALSALNAALGESAASGLQPLLTESPLWVRPLVPALAGVLIARILRDAPEARGGGLGQVVRAVSQGGGLIPMRVGLVKLLASSVTIGSGGSAGREGPIVQVGGSLGSTVAQALGFTRRDLAVLVGCGSAGGIAASFNAPIAGAMFALEIILREFEVRIFAPIVLASVTATMTAHAVMGEHLAKAGYRFVSTSEIAAYLLLGLLCGALAVTYVRGMALATQVFAGHRGGRLGAWLGRRTEWERCAVGGAVVGLVGLAVPQVMGAGQESLDAAVRGELPLLVLASAGLLKVLTTSVTLGSGASGGTFFPALFIGAMGGGAFGGVLERLSPGATGGAASYALVGMAACVAGSTRAPLTAIVIVFELTNNYTAILPLMVACTAASALCHATLGSAHAPGSLTAAIPELPVRALMGTSDAPLPADTPFGTLRGRLLESHHGVLALVDEAGRLTGLVVLRDIQETLLEELGPLVRAQDVARPPRGLAEGLDLRSARELLEDWELPAAPVIDAESRVVGMISTASIRAAARAALEKAGGGGGH